MQPKQSNNSIFWRGLAILSLLALIFIAAPAIWADESGSTNNDLANEQPFVASPDDFIITVKTDNAGTSSSTQFTIPIFGTGYNYNVDCDNDGTNEATARTGSYTCTYGAVGTYTIRISDNSGLGTGFRRIYFNNGGDRLKLLSIDQWGTGKWNSMGGAFYGCANMTMTATDTPDLSGVTDLSLMFAGAVAFNGNIGSWNTSTVTNMSTMFLGATSFNQNIGSWNTANVVLMNTMFFNASAFNQDISGWDTTEVQLMSSMFAYAINFNQPIGSWNTANVVNMAAMFQSAFSFNQDIGGWDTAKVNFMNLMFGNASAFNQPIGGWNTAMVTNMDSMFFGATTFNQDIGGWDTGMVTNMNTMFQSATAFNQGLGGWNVSSLTTASNMFLNVTLSTFNYDALLMGWEAQTLNSGVSFHGGNSKYCLGETARTNMTSPPDSWVITDGGKNCGIVWDGGGVDNNWSTAANWVGDVVPGAGATVSFNGTSDKGAIVNNSFAGTVGSLLISDQYDGNITLDRSLVVNGGYIQDGGSLTVNPAYSFSVNGTFMHIGGTLNEIRPVNAASVTFLQIMNSGATIAKYRGVEIDTTTSAANLGDTTVSITAVDVDSGEYCTTEGASSLAYAERCYTISPTTNGAARVRLWALTSELNGIAEGNLSVYHHAGSGTWTELLLGRATGNDGGSYSYAEGNTPGFSDFLVGQTGNAPTAIRLINLSVKNGDLTVLPIILPALLLLPIASLPYIFNVTQSASEKTPE